MYNWNQFRNIPKFKGMSAQEQARQYFLYQSNMMMEQSSNAALAPAAAAAAAGAGGGRLPQPEKVNDESVLYWAKFLNDENPNDQTLKSFSINFADGSTEVYDTGLGNAEWNFAGQAYDTIYKSYKCYFSKMIKNDNSEAHFVLHNSAGKYVDSFTINTNLNWVSQRTLGLQAGAAITAYSYADPSVWTIYYTDGSSKFKTYTFTGVDSGLSLSAFNFDSEGNLFLIVDEKYYYAINPTESKLVYEKTGADSVSAGQILWSGFSIKVMNEFSKWSSLVVVRPDFTVETIDLAPDTNAFNQSDFILYGNKSWIYLFYISGQNKTFMVNYDGGTNTVTTHMYNSESSFSNRLFYYSTMDAYDYNIDYSGKSTAYTFAVVFCNIIGSNGIMTRASEMDIVYISQGENKFHTYNRSTNFWTSLFNTYPEGVKNGIYFDMVEDDLSGDYKVVYLKNGNESIAPLLPASTLWRVEAFRVVGNGSAFVVMEGWQRGFIIKEGALVYQTDDLYQASSKGYSSNSSNYLRWGAVSFELGINTGNAYYWTEWKNEVVEIENAYASMPYITGAITAINEKIIGADSTVYPMFPRSYTYDKEAYVVSEEGGQVKINHQLEPGFSNGFDAYNRNSWTIFDTGPDNSLMLTYYSLTRGNKLGSVVIPSYQSFNNYFYGQWNKRNILVYASANLDNRISLNKYYALVNGNSVEGYMFPEVANQTGGNLYVADLQSMPNDYGY